MKNKFVKGLVKSTLALSLAFVSLSSLAGSAPPTDIGFGLPVVIEPGSDLIEVNSSGGFGIPQPAGYWAGLPLDVSSVFSNGFNFGRTLNNDIINYSAASQFKFGGHGQVIFHSNIPRFSILDPNRTDVGQEYSNLNGPSFGLHAGLWCIECGAGAPSPGGNSTGTSRVYTHLDPINNVVTITYDDVKNRQYWNSYWTPNKNAGDQAPTAAQMRFHDIGSGNFVLEFRYENIGWGKSGVAGWSNDDFTNFVTLDQNTDYSTGSNIGQPGVYAWMFVDGQVVSSGAGSNKVLEGSANGTAIGSLSTEDPDDNETFTYTLLDNAEGRFILNIRNNVTYVDVADGGERLDVDENETHDILVSVEDSAGNRFEKTLTINVIKVPAFLTTTQIDVPVEEVMNVTIITRVEQGSPIPTVTAEELPAWMAFADNGDGTVTLSGFPSFELRFPVTLTVTDGFGNQTTQTFYINATEIDDIIISGPTTTTITSSDGGTFGWLLVLIGGAFFVRKRLK